MQAKVDSFRKALSDNDAEAINAEMEALTQASYKITEQMYKDAAQNEGQAQDEAAADDKSKDGEVVDAEFEENNPQNLTNEAQTLREKGGMRKLRLPCCLFCAVRQDMAIFVG